MTTTTTSSPSTSPGAVRSLKLPTTRTTAFNFSGILGRGTGTSRGFLSSTHNTSFSSSHGVIPDQRMILHDALLQSHLAAATTAAAAQQQQPKIVAGAGAGPNHNGISSVYPLQNQYLLGLFHRQQQHQQNAVTAAALQGVLGGTGGVGSGNPRGTIPPSQVLSGGSTTTTTTTMNSRSSPSSSSGRIRDSTLLILQAAKNHSSLSM